MIRYTQRLYWVDTMLWLCIAGLPALPGLVIREFFNQLTPANAEVLWSTWGWIALLLGIGLAQVVTIILGRITKTQHRFTMSALIQRNLLTLLFNHPGAAALSVDSGGERPLAPGEVISFFREDVAQIEDNVVGTNEVLGEGVFAIGSLLVLFSVNPGITLFVFLPLAIIAIILHRVDDRLKRYRRTGRQATQQVTGMLGELFSAVQAIQVAGAESTMLRNFQHLCDRRSQAMVKDQLLTAILESSFEHLVSLGTGAILLFAAQSMGARTEQLKVGDLALFVYYLAYITNFFGFLGNFLALSKQSEVSFERMESLVKTEASALVAHHPLYLPLLTGAIPPLPRVPPLPKRNRSLQELLALNLTYHYPNSDRGITNLSLKLQRGSLTVVTGAMGSGKTTLLQALLGLLPLDSGEVYWNGQSVIDAASFFVPPQVAYTPQVPRLLSATLRENILLGLPISEAVLEEVIALATLDRDLAAMPQGLDTPIGARGMQLSGGQLQRVGAARMLIRKPELLVFDDLSSALDQGTEQQLWSNLLQLSSQTWRPTFLVVSHRRTVLERADHIILLNQGKLEGEGTFFDLPTAYFK
jgi:ABC-type multidrug transport system fused ATPase/permease subunit